MWVPAHACDVSIWSNIWRDSRPTRRKPQRLGAAARRYCSAHGDACRPAGDEPYYAIDPAQLLGSRAPVLNCAVRR
jgi:hypothetical protein